MNKDQRFLLQFDKREMVFDVTSTNYDPSSRVQDLQPRVPRYDKVSPCRDLEPSMRSNPAMLRRLKYEASMMFTKWRRRYVAWYLRRHRLQEDPLLL